MSFPIDTTIPNAPNDPADDQPKIKDNFANINSLFNVNHYLPGSVNNGKHEKVEMPTAGTKPPSGLVASEATLYGKSANGASQVFFTPDTTNDEYQLTRAITASFAKFSTNTALASANGNGGWTFLPGGMLLQYGSFNPNTSINVSFPISFTGTPYSVQLTGSADNNSTFRAAVSTGSLSSSGFTFEGSVSSHWNPIYFVAIGK